MSNTNNNYNNINYAEDKISSGKDIWLNWMMTVIRNTPSVLLDARQPFASPPQPSGPEVRQ